MLASKKRLVRKVTLAALSLGAAVQGCDSSEEKIAAAHYAEHCSLDSECLGDLVCVFEHCHVECNDDEDCRERGGRCVRVPAEDAEQSTTIGVCQLPAETGCVTTEECKGKQICAEDAQCHDPCSSKDPCFSWLSCSNSGECAERTELDSNGDLIVGAGGAGNGQTGGGGAGGSGGTQAGTGGSGSTATGGTSGGTPDAGGSGAGGEGGTIGSGGTGANPGSGTSTSGGAPTTGGTGSSAGDSSQAGAGAEGGGAGGAGAGTHGDVYSEDTDAVEAVPNDDRDHTLPLPKQGSLWLPALDQDWFYIDVPDDGRAHVIELSTHPGAGERAYVAAFAKLDDSPIGQVLLPEGTTRSVFITVGSGTRTNISFTCDRPGRLEFELVGVTQENDVHEPNNDRYTAKPVQLNTAISGQQIVPYTNLGGIDVSDWFQVTLAAGPAAVNVVNVPANVGLSITMMDDTNTTTTVKKLLPGVIGSTAVTIAKAGVYRFQLSDHSNSGLAAFYSGAKPESLDKTYTVRFEQ